MASRTFKFVARPVSITGYLLSLKAKMDGYHRNRNNGLNGYGLTVTRRLFVTGYKKQLMRSKTIFQINLDKWLKIVYINIMDSIKNKSKIKIESSPAGLTSLKFTIHKLPGSFVFYKGF